MQKGVVILADIPSAIKKAELKKLELVDAAGLERFLSLVEDIESESIMEGRAHKRKRLLILRFLKGPLL